MDDQAKPKTVYIARRVGSLTSMLCNAQTKHALKTVKSNMMNCRDIFQCMSTLISQ